MKARAIVRGTLTPGLHAMAVVVGFAVDWPVTGGGALGPGPQAAPYAVQLPDRCVIDHESLKIATFLIFGAKVGKFPKKIISVINLI